MNKRRRSKFKNTSTVAPNRRRHQNARPITIKKKICFALVAFVGFFVALESILWFIGIQPIVDQSDPYVGFSSQVPLLAEKQIDGTAYMVTAKNKLRWFNQQQIVKEKSDNAYRIFCLGGSTTYGRPYDDATSFSGWLREFLVELDSAQEFEVFNAGGISYASYRLVQIMRELANYQPDLFIVYTGHNEFLEERTYRDIKQLPIVFRQVGGILSNTRSYAAAHRLLRGESDANRADRNPIEGGLNDEVLTRLDNGIGLDAYQRDDELQARILEHFRYNLEQMVVLARKAGARMVLVTPASNLADCAPFKSQHHDGFSTENVWQSHLENATSAFEDQRFQEARLEIIQALELSPHYASALYLHGQILYALGETQAAKQFFQKARDEDICPLRALTQSIKTVRKVADVHDVPLIDFEELISQESANQIPGESFFLDHVHPTIEGHRMLAERILDHLSKNATINLPENWHERRQKVVARVHGRIDKIAQGKALRNLSKVLNWAGKKEEANRLALQASGLIGGDAETIYLAGNALLAQGKSAQAIQKFKEALQIAPHHVQAHNSLATAYHQTGKLADAEREYLQVIKLQADFAPAHSNLGALYQRQKKYELAIDHFREAIRINPRYSKAYNNLAILYRRKDDLDEAGRLLRKALNINPSFAEAHYNLGTILERQDQRSAALASYQQAVRHNPKYAPAHFRIGIYFEEEREWKRAATAYRDALALKNVPLDALRRTAWMLATCPDQTVRNGKIAVKMAQTYIQNREQDPDGYSTLAAAHAETGEFEKASHWQLKAIQSARDQRQKATHQRRYETIRAEKPLRQ